MFKNIIMILVAFLMLTGCEVEIESRDGSKRYKEKVSFSTVILEKDKEKISKFIIEVVAAANPHSDEEPEDNIKEAKKTAFLLFGTKTIGLNVYTSSKYYHFVQYSQLSDRQKKICDNFMK